MFIKAREKGQALILIALAAIGLFSFSALAVDGGRVYSDKRHAQNAADTAVLAAALAKIRGEDYVTAGEGRALSNGYEQSTVDVKLCSEVPCPNLPDDANPAEYIKVTITSVTQTTFARVLGRESVTTVVEAVARAFVPPVTGEEGVPGVPGATATPTPTSPPGSTPTPTFTPTPTLPPTPVPFFFGAGLSTLKPTGEKTLEINGNATLDIINSGTFVNSNSNCAMHANGNIDMSVDTAFGVVGTLCTNGNIHRDGPVVPAAPIPYPPALNIPVPNITCTGTGYKSGNTYYPGTWSSQLLFNGNGNVTMMPGNYCLQNGANFNGNTNITAHNVNVKLTGGEFIINGNSTFTCSNATFLSEGYGQGFRFNGNGNNNCTEVLFYARTGEVKWNGNVANTFQAKTSGPYKGLLIYMPYENTTPLDINGNAGNHIKGTILAVRSHININGNSGTEVMNSEVIGYTMKFNGNGVLRIVYDGDENYQGTGSEVGITPTPTPTLPAPTPTQSATPTATPTSAPSSPGDEGSIELVQ
jgi:Flp pilus assembly protein TadG